MNKHMDISLDIRELEQRKPDPHQLDRVLCRTIRRLRRQIRRGTYLTPHKLEVAVERMIREEALQ